MLGERIAGLRRQAGMSQAQLAQRLRISASAVGMYEQGRREPSAELLVSMAEVFCVTVDYLLTGQPCQPQLLTGVAQLEQKLSRRKSCPFTRQELTVIYAALMLES